MRRKIFSFLTFRYNYDDDFDLVAEKHVLRSQEPFTATLIAIYENLFMTSATFSHFSIFNCTVNK